MTRFERIITLVSVMGCLSAAGCSAEGGANAAASAEPERVGSVEQAGRALETCENWRPTGWGPLGGPNSVGADCRTMSGGWRYTEVWMPGCVANLNHGFIWARDGFFDRSCKNCFVGTTRDAGSTKPFCCYCAPRFELPVCINLNDLSNWDGNLVCPI